MCVDALTMDEQVESGALQCEFTSVLQTTFEQFVVILKLKSNSSMHTFSKSTAGVAGDGHLSPATPK